MSVLGLVGCGFIGSSFALDAIENGIFDRVVGTDTNSQHLSQALELGIIDAPIDGIGCDAICIAVPISSMVEVIQELAEEQPKGTVLFDVGSVKSSILEDLNPIPPNYVPCHPLAGSHKNGPTSAVRGLFRDRVCVLTPTDKTNMDRCQQASKWWKQIGSSIQYMSPQEHDRAVAITSHLPHFLSAVAAKITSDQSPEVQALIGTGFMDFSRIAAGDARVWRDIFTENGSNLLDSIDLFQDQASKLAEMVQSDSEELEQTLEDVANFRRSLDSS